MENQKILEKANKIFRIIVKQSTRRNMYLYGDKINKNRSIEGDKYNRQIYFLIVFLASYKSSLSLYKHYSNPQVRRVYIKPQKIK